ncbi:MAG: ParB/RepB/Spo0J family partition protein [Clostridiales bacterium]|jgi:ParB family chromosome partitioning protein|nr:ParB/RepB/Spo0J family partition protein [Clostridiales bacterium]
MAAFKGLGKGLSALLADSEQEYGSIFGPDEPGQKTAGGGAAVPTQEVSIQLIEPNKNQPRKNFDEVALNELANSIRIHGVISPIIVVPRDGGKYMIIAGERRYRACKKVGLPTMPVIVKNYTDQQIKEISLIDNLQREDLNPIETALAIRQLMDEYRYTQEQVADRIGKSRPAVTNTLRLLNLAAPVRDMVAEGKLSPGHARCLVVVDSEDAQIKLAKQGADNQTSVRDFEKMVKSFLNPKTEKPAPAQSIELKDLILHLQRTLKTKVSILGNDKKGRIYIDYYTRDDLDRLSDILDIADKYI